MSVLKYRNPTRNYINACKKARYIIIALHGDVTSIPYIGISFSTPSIYVLLLTCCRCLTFTYFFNVVRIFHRVVINFPCRGQENLFSGRIPNDDRSEPLRGSTGTGYLRNYRRTANRDANFDGEVSGYRTVVFSCLRQQRKAFFGFPIVSRAP